jgi:hypothetical protein
MNLRRHLWASAVVVVGVVPLLAVAVGAWRQDAPPSGLWASAAAAAEPVTRREHRPTLDPAKFVGRARVTHQIAREIPDVLDQLYCYCGCDKSVGHRSLLSCFTDGHAAT